MLDADDMLHVSDDESKLVIRPPPLDETSADGTGINSRLPPDARITINLLSYEKRGDGMNAYLVYKIQTFVSNIPGYNECSYTVCRRFSDFLGLREKLVEKYQLKGYLVPLAPEKSITALTKTKLNASIENVHSNDIVDKRARQLQRFLRRIARHHQLVDDCDFRDFLTIDGELPKAAFTSALSSQSVKKMFKSFGDMFAKIAFPMDETDRWFEQVHSQVDELDELMGKLLGSLELLVIQRRDLAHADASFSRGLSMLASCEENTDLARTLSKMAETHEALEMIEKHMTEQDSVILMETIQEHMGLTNVMKEVFFERVKAWQAWQNTVQTLNKKREAKTRNELAGRTERANQYKQELSECEQKVDQMERDFQSMSSNIHDEFNRSSKERRDDIREALLSYFDSLIESERQCLEHWEKLLPEVQDIPSTTNASMF